MRSNKGHSPDTEHPSLIQHPLVRNSAAILGLVLVVAVAAWVVSVPWSVASPPPTLLARYLPLRDGAGTLRADYDGEGKFVKWASTNLRVLLRGRVIAGELRKAQYDALEKFLQGADEEKLSEDAALARLMDAQVYQEDTAEVDAAADPRRISRRSAVTVRNAQGDYTLALYYAETGSDVVFDPPALVLPADLSPARAPWTSKGKLGSLDYELTGQVLQAGAFGAYDDCLLVQVRTRFSGEAYHSDETDRDWLCAGAGFVDIQGADENGKPLLKSVIVSRTGELPNVAGLDVTPAPTVAAVPLEATESGWTLERFARLGKFIVSGEATIPPAWIPTDPPGVLDASLDGDLVAYEAEGASRWRFHTGGAIFGPPAFDAARGRIFFGSSDKHLYALDARGFFLWAFPTGDNVATRPAVVGDVVVFGSEDRSIYGLDADTGQEKWRVATGGPVVSSPAVADSPAGSLVVIGSDDGGIYGLDAATGTQRWLYTAGVIEAPVVVADGTAYAASRDGNVYAVDANTGDEIWTADVGGVLRTAPALTADRVFVTNFDGNVAAIERATGRVLRKTTEGVYTGTPAVNGDTLVVAGSDGNVYALSFELARVHTWVGPGGSAGFRFGPAAGGGALWLDDNRGVIWRLGPPQKPAPLTLRWTDAVGTPPLSTFYLTTTPARYGDQIAVVDNDNQIYLVNPASGKMEAKGPIAAEGTGTVRLDPVVAGDALLTVIGTTLYATDLRTGQALWKAPGDSSFFAPVVADDTVLWVTQSYTLEGSPVTLTALDLATGKERWHDSFKDLAVASGVTARDGVAYLGSPESAYDIATGKRLWQAPSGDPAIGVPAVSADGATVFIAHLGNEKNNVSALDTTGSRTRWRSDVAGNITFTEPLWVSGDILVVPFSSPSISQGLGGMVGLDAATGAERWRFAPPVPRLGGVTVDGGMVWMVLEDGQVLGVDAQTGKLAAQYRDLELNLNGTGAFQRPLAMNGLVVVPTGGQVWGLETPAQK